MNKLLQNKYSLFGKRVEKTDGFTKILRKFIANPIGHYILFGIIICIIGYIAGNKLMPDVIPYSWQSGLATTFSFAIASVGFCLLMGYSGLASLATGGFMGIGTYSVYYVMEVAGLPFIMALLIAIAIAVGIGLIVGFISLRIEGIYLVILTLGLSEILRQVFVAVKDTIRISGFQLFGMEIERTSSIYVVTVMLVIIMIITNNLINSPTGRAMLAMKNSTAAAQAMGINVTKYRLFAFVICTLYAAVAGLMLMMTVRAQMASIGTSVYALLTSLNILAAVIIGGFKSIWGAVVGTFIMYGLESTLLINVEFLAKNPVIITFVSGVLVILVVMFYPGGLAQLLKEAINGIKKICKKIKERIYGKDLG